MTSQLVSTQCKSRPPIATNQAFPIIADRDRHQILIAVLNRYYNFANPDDLGYVYFYAAEVATAVYVGNIPLCWQLARRIFHVGTWAGFEDVDEQTPDRQCDDRKRKRVLHPTLPASLFSTQASTMSSFCFKIVAPSCHQTSRCYDIRVQRTLRIEFRAIYLPMGLNFPVIAHHGS